MLTRRAALIAALAAPAAVRAGPLPFFGAGTAIGINLYMVAGLFGSDPDGTLAKLSAIGFREVEADLARGDPKLFRAQLDRHGLRCVNLGILPQPLRGGLSLESDAGAVAEAVHQIGADHLTCTLFPLPAGVEMRPLKDERVDQMLERVVGTMKTDDWKRTADFLNAKGEDLRRHGVRFGYHNHNPEFAPRGETNGLAILLEHTDPKLVDFEMDAGWVVASGNDPVEILRAYPGRFHYMHVKDVAPESRPNTAMRVVTVPVGSGIVDWPRVLEAARTAGVKHFAIEQEPPYPVDPLESARRGFAYLSTLSA